MAQGTSGVTDGGSEARGLVRAALEALGIDTLLLGIHDPAFPGDEDEDVGHGSPGSRGGARFLEFAHALGFSGLQLGPQGATWPGNPSPYDGTIFSRNPLSVALGPLVEAGLLSRATLDALLADRPRGADRRVRYDHARTAQARALDEAFARCRTRESDWAARLARFRTSEGDWLVPDALYAALRTERGLPWTAWREGQASHPDRVLWSAPRGEALAPPARRRAALERHALFVERDAFVQLLAHEQHAEVRRLAASLGLELFGDLQVGLSEGDAWSRQDLFLADYLMGAPPSRTNSGGQPWGYRVLDPGQYHAEGGPGPARRFFARRLAKAFAEFDGLRVDHPHGLVCPWVYRSSDPDPLRAVRHGARLFESPDLPDHPELRRHAIARPEQIDASRPRHADDWVRDLTPEQVERYAALLDDLLAAAARAGRPGRVACEVLSTLPRPLQAVMERHGLGRFRVTQKADLARADDVYRGENAAARDWVMVGTHDTPSLRFVGAAWSAEARRQQAAYLATRLVPEPAHRERWAARTASDLPELLGAKLAELFVGPARHVMVFFTDLFGFAERYNAPGTVGDENWSLRVPPDFEAAYRSALGDRSALHLPRVLAQALRARGGAFVASHAPLLARLEDLAPRS